MERAQPWQEGGWRSKLHWQREGQCARCQDVWDDERGIPVASVAETPPDATEAVRENLRKARRLIGKPLCSECEDKLRRKAGGDLIAFGYV
ncbi:MAG: hypothetical protein A2655_01605 [Candidatus Yanofskybacteria bacterium RIFCSPHIGHO2_01_FULL_43_42]|uniref:Uncharacterized protein n=1 Tax=Candidatus Yanofskybacteria bacterium RIFCSPLOWO2_01_FULL_43_22 TaxID=1802695 RepID=A0A1F8GJJ1_9BACT|nr:MAG: hypothetical protein A2655_01605 [Candidatus Yanofskybacteria bacterium RIFCSPHIGHO2_01_FULL_43_42]OGN24589.1 MAG: hypothetical protein A3A13_00735 [Candidatus Yanofskybacteria bacterium RIFCSPLOWO2_01_FULL_43_22]